MLRALAARVSAVPDGKRLLSGTLWTVGGAALANIVTLLVLGLVARLLGATDFGRFVLTTSTTNMVGAIAGVGVGNIAVREVAEWRNRDRARLGRRLGLLQGSLAVTALAASVGAMLGAHRVANWLGDPSIARPLAFAAPSILFLSLDGYMRSILLGLQQARSFATATFLSAAMSSAALLLGSVSGNVDGASIALSVGAALQCSLSALLANRALKPHAIAPTLVGARSELSILGRLALPALVGNVFVAPVQLLCTRMLVQHGHASREVALVGIALQWFTLLMFVPSISGRIVLPLLTERYANDESSSGRRLLRASLVANLVVTVPVAIGVAVVSPWLLRRYGAGFDTGALALAAAAAAACFASMTTPAAALIMATGRVWWGVGLNGVWAACYLLLASTFVARGADGQMGAMALSYAALCVLTLVSLRYAGWDAPRPPERT